MVLDDLFTQSSNLISHVDSWGRNPLLIAVASGHIDMVRRLLQKDDVLCSEDVKHGTALCIATRNGHSAIVDLLLTPLESSLIVESAVTASAEAAMHGMTLL